MEQIIDDLWFIIRIANDEITCGKHDERTRTRFVEISEAADRVRVTLERQQASSLPR